MPRCFKIRLPDFTVDNTFSLCFQLIGVGQNWKADSVCNRPILSAIDFSNIAIPSLSSVAIIIANTFPSINKKRIYSMGQKKKSTTHHSSAFQSGAGDEARTRYLHLGKVALYQMSYARIWPER